MVQHGGGLSGEVGGGRGVRSEAAAAGCSGRELAGKSVQVWEYEKITEQQNAF